MAVVRRLQRELMDVLNNLPQNISASPIDESDIYHWQGVIFGAKDTPYEGGMFLLDIQIPPEYPFKPPKVKFITKMFHPNISEEGLVCRPILMDAWSPALKIYNVLQSVESLLMDVYVEENVYLEAAEVYIKDKAEYYRKVKEYTTKYAR